jgi:hypothetical protein
MSSGATYYVRGPMPAQDGATVWTVVRALEGCTRLVSVAEYMSEHAAIRAAAELNAVAEKAAGLAV